MTGWTLTPTGPAAMASRRGQARPRLLWLVLAGLAATVLLAGAIRLGNSVTQLRREIQDLQRQQEVLVARGAVLSLQWNRDTSRQTIIGRAEAELALVRPDDPGTVVLTRHAPTGETRSVEGELARQSGSRTALTGVVTP